MSCLSPVSAGCQLGSARALCPTAVAPGEASSSSCHGNLHGARRKPPACCGWKTTRQLGVAVCQSLGLMSVSCCAQHPTPAVPWAPHEATRGKKCSHLPQPSSETGLEQCHHARCPYPIAGITRVQRLLFWGAGLLHRDALSPWWGEPALPAPLAMHTVISAGRAEASLIIGGDSLAGASRAWGTAGLSGRAGLRDRLASRCAGPG